MPQLKLGIQLASLRQPFPKALLTAARLGAQGVEIDARNEVFASELSQTGLRHVRKMLDDLNLRVCAVSFPTRRGYGTPDDLERRIAATKRAMRLAFELRAPVVVNQIGSVPSESAGPQWDMLLDSLRELGHYGQHVGAQLAAETGSESGADLKRLLNGLSESLIAVDLNPAKLLINGYSPLEAVEQLGPYIRHVHANDGVRELSRSQGVELELGRGAVEFPQLLGALENFQYRGYLTVERLAANHPEQEIQRALEYLRSL